MKVDKALVTSAPIYFQRALLWRQIKRQLKREGVAHVNGFTIRRGQSPQGTPACMHNWPWYTITTKIGNVTWKWTFLRDDLLTFICKQGEMLR